MADINTHFGKNQKWTAYKNGHNELLISLKLNGLPFDISNRVFNFYVRLPGQKENKLSLSQTAGQLVNGGVDGTILIPLTKTNASVVLTAFQYFMVLEYTIGGEVYPLLQGALTLSAELNPGSPTQYVTIPVNMDGVQMIADVTLFGSGTMTGAEIVTALGAQPATHFLGGPTPAFRALAIADLPFTGTPDATKFSRGDGVWAAVGGGAWGTITGTLSGQTDLQSALDGKTPIAHATNTLNPHSVTKTQVGLGNVDNTSDANKPVSIAQQTALDLKSPLASPTFTVVPAAPTAAPGTDTTQLATTAFVTAAVAAGSGGGSWLLASGGTLTGANTIIGSAANTLKYQFDALGVTQVNGAGHWLANTTAAAAGVQQISPSIVWEGQGWKTNTTAASQSVKFAVDVLPVQGAANPLAEWSLSASINNAAYIKRLLLKSGGEFQVLNNTASPLFRVHPLGGVVISTAIGYSIYLGEYGNLIGLSNPVEIGWTPFGDNSSNAKVSLCGPDTGSILYLRGGATAVATASNMQIWNTLGASRTNADVVQIGWQSGVFTFDSRKFVGTGTAKNFSFMGGGVTIGGETITNDSTLLDLQSTTKALLLPRVTNTASVTTPVNGMIIYDVALGKVRVYEGGAWASVI